MDTPRSSCSCQSELVSTAAVGTTASNDAKERVFVCVRIRPLLPHEAAAGEKSAWKATGAGTLVQSDVQDRTPSDTKPYQPSAYYYNRVFPATSTSEEVYADSAQQLVLSAMQGYNCTLFAYGQTGSGKTHTMRSIMKLAARDIFGHIEAAPDREFLLRLSAIQVYNEVVSDLLADAGAPLKVLDDPERGNYVENLSEEGVRSAKHLEELLKVVENHRHVRDTRMNQSSSRSHQIVRLYVESRPATRPSADQPGSATQPEPAEPSDDFIPVTISTINFVDLAGSERLSQAASEDADKEKLRQKEASNINKSLLTLGTVIRALGDTQSRKHVPYRDSKITRILQPSLSGNARMAIICTISPASGSAENTRAALHFANAAKKVLMRPQVNEVADEKAIIRRMQAEIQGLKKQLMLQSWWSEAEQMSAALSEKEELVRKTAEEKERLQKQLANLEKLILRGDGMVKQRRSFDGSIDLAASLVQAGPDSNSIQPHKTLRRLASIARTSWNPSSSMSTTCNDDLSGTSASGNSGSNLAVTPTARRPSGQHQHQHQDRLLLDYFLAPSVRRAADRSGSIPAVSMVQPTASSSKPPQVPKLDISKVELQRLQTPKGQRAEEALAALQAEVRCIKHSSHIEDLGTAIQNLTAELNRLEVEEAGAAVQAAGATPTAPTGAAGTGRQELVLALRAEVARLHAAQEASSKAHQALESLQRKIQSAADEGTYDEDAETAIAALPGWLQQVLSGPLSHRNACRNGPPSHRYRHFGDSLSDSLSLNGGGSVVSELQQPGQMGRNSQRNSQGSQTGGQSSGRMSSLLQLQTGHHSPPDTPNLRGEAANLQGAAALQSQAHRPFGHGSPRLNNGPHARDTGHSKDDNAKVAHHNDGDTSLRHNLDQFIRESNLMPLMGSPAASLEAPLGSHHAWTAGADVAVPLDNSSHLASTAPSMGSDGTKRWETDKLVEVLRSQKEAVRHWYRAELRRMQVAFKSSAEKDVSSLREALDQYREQIERLEMQKKLLVNQVLKLEYSVEEHERSKAELEQQLYKSNLDRDQARFETVQAKAMARAAAAAAASAQATASGVDLSASQMQQSPERLSMFDADEGWSAQDTPESMMPRIMELWEELYVPLAYRSRFYLNFRGKEVFYYEMEYRRLEWKRSAAAAAAHTSGSSPFSLRNKEIDRAARALDWERKHLAQQLKYCFDDEGREGLFREWVINPATKERKLQLVHKLWSPRTLAEPEGALRSAELVTVLSGMDAAEQFMELVFGNPEGGSRPPSALGVVMGSLVRRVATPRKRPPLSNLSRPPSPRNNSFGSISSKLLNMSFLSRQRSSSGNLQSQGPASGDTSILSGVMAQASQGTPRGHIGQGTPRTARGYLGA